jgi:hypothetical protein
MAASPETLLRRLRSICVALPEVTERPSHGAPTFFVRQRPAFLMAWIDGHHDRPLPHFWCAGPPGAQDALVEGAPERFFRPPYVGHRGWIGVSLDGRPDWAEVEDLCEDAYRSVAPRRLVAMLES